MNRGAGRDSASLLCSVARVALAAGATVSLALMFHAGRHQQSIVLVAMFTLWVLSPFAALALADIQTDAWPFRSRAALYRTTIVLCLLSVAVYAADVTWHLKAQTAFVFIVAPAASWALGVMLIAAASRRSHRA